MFVEATWSVLSDNQEEKSKSKYGQVFTVELIEYLPNKRKGL